jgi:hypothetical protein
MTPIPTIWQRQETAGWSAATKLQAFLESLTPDEQQAIELGLRRLVVLAEESTGDAAGYVSPTVSMGLIARLAAELELYRQWAEAYQSWR